MKELVGKLNYIRFVKRYHLFNDEQVDSTVYLKLAARLKALKPELNIDANTTIEAVISADRPIVICEGKTDWKLIKKALNLYQNMGEFTDLKICFREYDDCETAGTSILKKFCESNVVLPRFKHKCICLCDRDEPKTNICMTESGIDYKFWGNNIYSVLLPVPSHREFDEICIEMLFSDEEIKTVDKNGRRLFLSTEFNKDTGEILDGTGLKYVGPLAHICYGFPKIIDKQVIDSSGKNMALPKSTFAKNFFYGVPPFNKFSLEGFRPLFEEIRYILSL